MSDHNVVSAPVKLLDHFSRNRRCNTAVEPTIDRQLLTTDPDLRKEVADAIENFLRANTPSGSSIDVCVCAYLIAHNRAIWPRDVILSMLLVMISLWVYVCHLAQIMDGPEFTRRWRAQEKLHHVRADRGMKRQ